MLAFLADTLSLFIGVLSALFEAVVSFFWPPPPKDLSGETAVVTGAGHGIGRELALQLAEMGVRVVCWDICQETCQKTADEANAIFKGSTKKGSKVAWAVKCDVSKREDVRRAVEDTRCLAGDSVTMLFNNAGIMPARPFLKFTSEDIEKLFKVNVLSQYWTLQEYLPEFLSKDYGHIISMSSVAGITGTPYLTPYCSTKFAIKGLMDSLFLELRKDCPDTRVRLTTIHPFTINTGLAHNPTTRFPRLIPITEPGSCAQQIIAGVRRNDEEVYIPGVLNMSFKLGRCLPRKAQLAINDFLNCGVGYKA